MAYTELRQYLAQKAATMRAEFQAEARTGFGVRSGTLGRSFRQRVMQQQGDPVGISFTMPRYGYILHHGIKSGTVVRRKSGSYTTRGIAKSDFLNKVLDRHVGDIADEVAKAMGDEVESRIRF